MSDVFTPKYIKMMRETIANDGNALTYVDAEDFLTAIDEVERLQQCIAELERQVKERNETVIDLSKDVATVTKRANELYGQVKEAEVLLDDFDIISRWAFGELPDMFQWRQGDCPKSIGETQQRLKLHRARVKGQG